MVALRSRDHCPRRFEAACAERDVPGRSPSRAAPSCACARDERIAASHDDLAILDLASERVQLAVDLLALANPFTLDTLLSICMMKSSAWSTTRVSESFCGESCVPSLARCVRAQLPCCRRADALRLARSRRGESDRRRERKYGD